MSDLLRQIKSLIAADQWEITTHGFKKLNARNLSVSDIVAGTASARIVEEYPDYYAGPCLLILFESELKLPVHALWGIPLGKNGPACLMTAYIPDPDEWLKDNMTRRKP